MAIRVRYEPAAAGLAHAADITGRGQLAKESQKFAFDVDRFQTDLAERQREFDINQALNEKRFDENVRQFGMDYALRESGFEEGVRQFDVGQDLGERQLGEGIRQFDLGHDLNKDQFSEGKRQFNVGDWLEKQKLLEGRRQYNLGLQEKYDSESQQNFRAGLTQQGAWDRAVMGEQGAWGRQEKGAEFQQAAEQRQEESIQGRFQQQQLTARMNSDWAAIQDNRRFWSEEEYNSAVGAFTEKYEPSGQPMPFAPEYTPPPGQAMLDEMRNSDDPDLRRIGDLSTLSPDGNSTMLKPGASEIFKIQSEERQTNRAEDYRIQERERKEMDSYRIRGRTLRDDAEKSRRDSERYYVGKEPKRPEPAMPGDPLTQQQQTTWDADKERFEADKRDRQTQEKNYFRTEEIRNGENFASSHPNRTFGNIDELREAKDSGAVGPGDLVMVRDVETTVITSPGIDGLYGTQDDKVDDVKTARFIYIQ